MTTTPPEKLDVQNVDMQRWLPFQFLTSLLRFGSGWFSATQETYCALGVPGAVGGGLGVYPTHFFLVSSKAFNSRVRFCASLTC